MQFLIRWLVAALVVIVLSYILPGAHVAGFLAALGVALVLGLANAVIKPVLIILTFPVTILTLGLFLLVINALMVVLTSWIVPGFTVDGFWWALVFSILVSLVNIFRGQADKTNSQ